MIKSRQFSTPATRPTDDVTTTAQTVAAGQLRAFIDRILRLKEEQDTIGDDVKEVYAEMKGVGFDRTAAGALVTEIRKKRKSGEAEFEERNTILDLYREAYEAGAQPSHTHASARTRENIEEFPPHDKETGEIFDDKNAQRPSINDEPSPEAGPQAEASLAGTGTGTLADREGRFEGEAASADLPTNSNSSDPTSSPEKTDAAATPAGVAAANYEIPDHATSGAADGQPSKPSSKAARAKNDGPQNAAIGQGEPKRSDSEQAVTIPDADVPAFLLKDRKRPPLRPHCLNPSLCAGSGREHCHGCKRALAESEAA